MPYDGAAAVQFWRDVRFGRRLHPGEATPARAFVVGLEPTIEPVAFVRAMPRAIKRQLQRSHNKHVRVQRMAHLRDDDAAAFEALRDEFLHHKPLPPLHFVAELLPLVPQPQLRVWTARRADALVGAAFVECGKNGWHVRHVLRARLAPNGTSEALVVAVVRAAADDAVTEVSLGLCPFIGPVPLLLRCLKAMLRPAYNAEGLWTFRQKFFQATGPSGDVGPHHVYRVLAEHPRCSRPCAYVHLLEAFGGANAVQVAGRFVRAVSQSWWRSHRKGSVVR